jgi:TcpE family
VDLPTYTNIWRIEKRLYKLYDFRLPAPLPINWIAVFTGITAPYILLLIAIGLPFNHTLLWLYVLPPGVLTWLSTRPVIENKRLPELLESQVRYIAEPRVWCRMTPLAEKGQVMVTARVWHSHRQLAERVPSRAPSMAALLERGSMARRKAAVPVRPARVPAYGAPVPGPVTAGVSAEVQERVTSSGMAAGKSGAGKRRLLKGGPAKSDAARPSVARGRPEWDRVSEGTAGWGASGGRRSVAALGTGQAMPAPPLSGYGATRHPMAPLAPAEAPLLATLPAHAAPISSPPVVSAVPDIAQPTGPATATPMVSATQGGAPQSSAPRRPVDDLVQAVGPGAPAAPVRARATSGPIPRIEVAHSGPAQRPVPSAPPVDPARAWPTTGPSRLLPPPPVQPTAGPTAVPEEPSAGQPQHPDAPRKELFSLLSSTTHARPQPPRTWTPLPAGTSVAGDSGVRDEDSEGAAEVAASAGMAEAQVDAPAPTVPPAPAPVAPAAPLAPAPAAPAGHAPSAPARERSVPSIERALSGPSRDRSLSWHAKVKIVAGAGQGPGVRDQEALDRARARLPLTGPKRVLMLGCTSGAGQTVTAMMTGHILASLREEPVAAVDLHDGTLARYTAPAAMVREVLDGTQPQGQPAAQPDGLPSRPRTERNRSQPPARLDVIASDDPLRDGDERRLAEHLGRNYPLTILDPGATGLTRLLKITDQLVIVAPASVEAAGALADTRDWLDAHGFAELAMHSVTLVSGVSRRSLPDVEAAEAVARGRCRAIVRVPWDDMLPVGTTSPSALHAQTRVAYTALAGVLVAGMAAAPVRRPQ